MTQERKVLAARSHALGSILRAQIMEGENQTPRCFLPFTHVLCHAQSPSTSSTHTHKTLIKNVDLLS